MIYCETERIYRIEPREKMNTKKMGSMMDFQIIEIKCIWKEHVSASSQKSSAKLLNSNEEWHYVIERE